MLITTTIPIGLLLLLTAVPFTIELKVIDPDLEIAKQWNVLDYDFPWDWPMNDKMFYNPLKIAMTGVEVGRKRLFVSTPRLYSGVPATLSVISREGFEHGPVLKPYPDWSHHQAGLKTYSCSDTGLVSVYRSRIDSCNRLWALDAGVSRSFEDFEKTCPPKILVYDLNTDKVVKR
jgi:Major royal jelly protein